MRKLNELNAKVLQTGSTQDLNVKNEITNNQNIVDFKRENGTFSLYLNEDAKFNIEKKKKLREAAEKNGLGPSIKHHKTVTKLKLKNYLEERAPIIYLYKVFRKSLLLDESFIKKNISKIKKGFYNNLVLLDEIGVFNFNEKNELLEYVIAKLNEAGQEEVEKLDDNIKGAIKKRDILHEVDDPEATTETVVNKVVNNDSNTKEITDTVSDNIKDNIARAVKDEQDRINKIEHDNDELEEVLEKNDDVAEDNGEDIDEVEEEVDEEQESDENEDTGDSEEVPEDNSKEGESSEEDTEKNNEPENEDDTSDSKENKKEPTNEDVRFLALRKKKDLKYKNTGTLFNSIQNGILKNALKVLDESVSSKKINMDLILAETISFYTLLETLNAFECSNLKTKNDIVKFCKFASEGF